MVNFVLNDKYRLNLMITKHIFGKDAYYTLTQFNQSDDKTVSLSSELLHLLALDAELGSETRVSLVLYQQDFSKAMGYILSKSPLFVNVSGSVSRVDGNPSAFISDFNAMCHFFAGQNQRAYEVTLRVGTSGKAYITDLTDKDSGFNIKHFLIDENSTLTFKSLADNLVGVS